MKKPAKPGRKQASSRKQKPARPEPQTTPPKEGGPRSLEATELRRRAEARLKERKKAEAACPRTAEETQRLVHELQVHQIELEMQNEELLQARAEVESLLAQYTDHYDFSPTGYFTLDRDGTIRQMNLTGARVLGIERSGLLNRRFGLFVSDDCRPAFNAFLDKVFASQGNETCEVVILKEGPEPLWVHIDARATEDGRECHAAVLDITERKRAEEALRETKDYLENLIRFANAPIIVWDSQLQITEFNRALEVLTGMARDTVIGKCLDILFPSESCEASMKLIRDALSGERWEVVDIPIRHISGETRAVLWNSAHITSPNGDIIATIAQGQDITDRKRAEDALRKSEKRYRIMFEGGAQGILVADVQTKRFVFANPSICRMLGYSQKELLQLGVADIHPKDCLAHVVSEFESQARGKNSLSPSLPCLRKDGNVFYADVSASAAIIDGRECSLGFFADVTDRKLAEEAARNAHEQLAEQQRREKEHVETDLEKIRGDLVRRTRLAAIGQISASIAHDLRNPLGAANNAIYYLRHGRTKDASKTAEYLEIIDQEIGVANRIISKLLDMARGREPAKKAVDLGRTVEEVFKAEPGAEQMRCRTAMCPDPFLVQADPDQLRRVIANLLSNAIQAMNGRGECLVEASRGPDGDTILFRDTGPGMPPEIRQRLFEPLVTNRTHGTGLGLTICREIVRRHGGAIEIIDHEEGGAAFEIRLPRQ